MVRDQALHSPQFPDTKHEVSRQRDRVEPELRGGPLSVDVDMRRLTKIVAHEVYAVWPGAQNRRHPKVLAASQRVGRASNSPATSAIQDVCVNHSGFQVPVPEQLLNCPNVVAVLEQVRREGVAEGVAAHRLLDVGGPNGRVNGPLNDPLVRVMPADQAGSRVGGAI